MVDKNEWKRRRKLKWRDIYVKARLTPTWKRFRKHQSWRINRKGSDDRR